MNKWTCFKNKNTLSDYIPKLELAEMIDHPSVYTNKNLSFASKLFLTRIMILFNGKDILDSNKALSEKVERPMRSVQSWLKELEEEGVIKRKLEFARSKKTRKINCLQKKEILKFVEKTH